MAAYDRPARLGGPGKLVEVDEVLLRHARPLGARQCDATKVLGIVCDGQVIAGIVGDRTRQTLHANILKYVESGSIIVTDDWAAYKGLDQLGFKHIAVNHSKGYFNEGGYSTCQIDSYWATLRRAMRGYHQVSPRNLWLFLAEIEFRYNLRHDCSSVFERLISHWPAITPDSVPLIEQRFDWRKCYANLGAHSVD
jgi:IS1 family transposase